MINYQVKPESSLAAIAGELFGDTSLFRELAEEFEIDEFNEEALEGFEQKILTISDSFVANIEDLKNTTIDGIFENLDLSQVKGGYILNSNPWQNISWLV